MIEKLLTENFNVFVMIAVVICMLIGVYSIIGAFFNWDKFSIKNAKTPIELLGRNGARILYVICGLIFIGIGIFLIIVT